MLGSSETEIEEVHRHVRERYARAAAGAGCCSVDCCVAEGERTETPETLVAPIQTPRAGQQLLSLGYSEEEIAQIPTASNLGLGCGNPLRLAQLKPGQTVLDLGGGAGIDCFLAANRVGPTGWVIGVDMTPEMIERAGANAQRTGRQNVEFRLGELEALPLADQTVDVIISNCVVNLVPNKRRAYAEAFRVLRAGGRLAISDMVALRPISPEDRSNASEWTSCLSGAETPDVLRSILGEIGFEQIRIQTTPSATGDACCESGDIVSAQIEAVRPFPS